MLTSVSARPCARAPTRGTRPPLEQTAVVPGRFDEAEGCVLCEAPPFEGAQGPLMAKVELALNGQQFAALPAGGAEFKYELPKGSKKK